MEASRNMKIEMSCFMMKFNGQIYRFAMVVLTIAEVNKTKRDANCFIRLSSFIKLTK